MKEVRLTFTQREHDTLTSIKNSKGRQTWHDFVMTLAVKPDIESHINTAPHPEDYYDKKEFYEAYKTWLLQLEILLNMQLLEEAE